MEKLLNKKEVAALFGITVKGINKWITEERIPYIRLSRKCVRFSPSALDAMVKKYKVSAKNDFLKQ